MLFHATQQFFFWAWETTVLLVMWLCKGTPLFTNKKKGTLLAQILFYFSIFYWLSKCSFIHKKVKKKKKKKEKKQVQFDFLYFWSDTLVKLLSKTIFLFRTIISTFLTIAFYRQSCFVSLHLSFLHYSSSCTSVLHKLPSFHVEEFLALMYHSSLLPWSLHPLNLSISYLAQFL